MKILHVLGAANLPKDPDNSPASGIVSSVLQIAREQAKLGHRVAVFSAASESWQASWEGVELVCRSKIPLLRFRLNGRIYDFSSHIPLLWFNYRYQFDVIHSHLYYYFRGLRSRGIVAHFHGDPFYKGDGIDQADLTLKPADIQLYTGHADALIGVSHFVGHQLQVATPGPANIQVVQNGVDLNHFAPMQKEIIDANRVELSIPSGSFILLYAGAIVVEKGVIQLARAFDQLAERYPDMYLILAGGRNLWGGGSPDILSTGYEQEVHETLARWTRERRVVLLGKVPKSKMPGLYNLADLTIVPSVCQEGFTLVAAESLACGTPVVASRVGGLVEYMNAGNGVFVEPENVPNLISAIRALYNDRARLGNLAREARQSVSHLTWTRCAAKIEEVYGTIF